MFFTLIRTHITKNTLWTFHGGNTRRHIFIWRIRWWLQFSHLPTYLLLWHLQLVNPQSSTHSWKKRHCSHSCTRFFLFINNNYVINKKNLFAKMHLFPYSQESDERACSFIYFLEFYVISKIEGTPNHEYRKCILWKNES